MPLIIPNVYTFLKIRADTIQTVKMEVVVHLLYVFAVPGTGDCFVNIVSILGKSCIDNIALK